MSETEPTEEEAAQFAAQFDSPAQILAFTYAKQGGEPLLRAVLDLTEGSSSTRSYREQLDEYADEIAESGMSACAAIVREYAERAPEVRYECPYPEQHIPGWEYTEHHGTRVVPYRTAQDWLADQQKKYPDFDLNKVRYVDPSQPYIRPLWVGIEERARGK
jgi:hypothetical protein